MPKIGAILVRGCFATHQFDAKGASATAPALEWPDINQIYNAPLEGEMEVK